MKSIAELTLTTRLGHDGVLHHREDDRALGGLPVLVEPRASPVNGSICSRSWALAIAWRNTARMALRRGNLSGPHITVCELTVPFSGRFERT